MQAHALLSGQRTGAWLLCVLSQCLKYILDTLEALSPGGPHCSHTENIQGTMFDRRKSLGEVHRGGLSTLHGTRLAPGFTLIVAA